VGIENILPAAATARQGGLVTVDVAGTPVEAVDAGESGPIFACIRAEDVALAREEPHGGSARNRIAGTVASVAVEGPLARVDLDCGFPLVALVTAQSAAELALRPGDRIWAVLKTTSVHLVPACP
jgi:molybdopterin-binding protein